MSATKMLTYTYMSFSYKMRLKKTGGYKGSEMSYSGNISVEKRHHVVSFVCSIT